MYYAFAKLMALFWTAVEAAVLVAVRRGHRVASGGEERQRGEVIALGAGLAAAGGLLFLAEPLAGRFLDLETRLPQALFRWALWNFFCTVWVVLEGCIMIYVCRLYRILRDSAVSFRRLGGGAGCSGVWLLAAGFLGLFLLYQAGLLHAVDRYGLEAGPVVRVSLFYVRICGLFWVLFEWVVAVQGFRAYGLLKRQGGP